MVIGDVLGRGNTVIHASTTRNRVHDTTAVADPYFAPLVNVKQKDCPVNPYLPAGTKQAIQ